MFVVGSVIFISYLFFYLRIVLRTHKKELTDTSYYHANDSEDIMAKKTSHKNLTKSDKPK